MMILLLMMLMTAIRKVIIRRYFMFAYNEGGRQKGDRLDIFFLIFC